MRYTLWAQVPVTSEIEKRGNESVLLDTVPMDHNYLLHSPCPGQDISKSS